MSLYSMLAVPFVISLIERTLILLALWWLVHQVNAIRLKLDGRL